MSLNGFYTDCIVPVQRCTFEFYFSFGTLEIKFPFELCQHKIPQVA